MGREGERRRERREKEERRRQREGKIKQPSNQPADGGYLTIWLLPIRK